jgi:hypothetical protein
MNAENITYRLYERIDGNLNKIERWAGDINENSINENCDTPAVATAYIEVRARRIVATAKETRTLIEILTGESFGVPF